MARLVVYYFVTTLTALLTKELVMAAEQCTVYRFKSPFFPGATCEDIYNANPESHTRSGYYWITDGPRKVFCGMTYAGSSCVDIYSNNPETRDKSGYYRINDTQWTFCNMTAIAASGFISTCAGVGGGWTRIANLDISVGSDCPTGWRKDTYSGVSFCRVVSDSGQTCSSAYFSTNGTSYQRVCGRARGYQKGRSAAFYGTGRVTIDGPYVEGLSITYGSPRQHIWTYADGDFDDEASSCCNCPCAIGGGPSPPSFVGTNYYCEAGAVDRASGDASFYYFNDTLWDGSNCYSSPSCCSNLTQPWFYHDLNGISNSSIEARICRWDAFSGGSILIDQMELYIQ